jgi:hypothetical protein
VKSRIGPDAAIERWGDLQIADGRSMLEHRRFGRMRERYRVRALTAQVATTE